MLFNSIDFLLFLPVAFLAYWFLFPRQKEQNLFIVAASYFFYACWDWRFLSLIIVTTVTSWLAGIFMERSSGHRQRLAINVANITVNLAILGVFKYLNFFSESFADLLRALGIHADLPTLSIVLPVGISFYTFQAVGYSIDVYRRRIKPTSDLVTFAAFVSFFPQLVAGPIERAGHLLPQFSRERQFSYDSAVDGCRQALWGFFKKVVVADNCAVTVDLVWNNPSAYSSLMLAVAAFLFTIQIYCDFSGYSDIAIGVARLFGINLSPNFRYPYFSTSIPDFWRRWHISLTTWFRDNVYFPLGGSRRGRWRTLGNTFIVFAVSGLWHGANYTFVVWGLYHALLFTPYILLKIPTKRSQASASDPLTAKQLALMAMTFLLVCVGWIFFRAPSLTAALHFMQHMLSADMALGDFSGTTPLLASLVCLAAEWLQRRQRHPLDFSNRPFMSGRWARMAVYYALLLAITGLSAHQESFIYFQF